MSKRSVGLAMFLPLSLLATSACGDLGTGETEVLERVEISEDDAAAGVRLSEDTGSTLFIGYVAKSVTAQDVADIAADVGAWDVQIVDEAQVSFHGDLVIAAWVAETGLTELVVQQEEVSEASAIESPDGIAVQSRALTVNNIDGNSGNNTLSGTNGADRLRGFGGNDTLRGLGGDDLIFGGNGNDALLGGSGNDDLRAGSNNDRIRGGPGNDRMNPGTGFDLIEKAPGDGHDTVRDTTANGQPTNALRCNSGLRVDRVELRNINRVMRTNVGSGQVITTFENRDTLYVFTDGSTLRVDSPNRSSGALTNGNFIRPFVAVQGPWNLVVPFLEGPCTSNQSDQQYFRGESPTFIGGTTSPSRIIVHRR